MKLCTCRPGDYPEVLQATGSRYAAVILTVFLSIWWVRQVVNEIRRMGTRSLCQMQLPVNWRRAELSEFDRKVVTRFHKTRVERYLWFLNVLRWVGAPAIVFVLAMVVWMSYIDDGVQLARFTVERVLPEGLLVTTYGLFFSQFPHKLTKIRADILFAFLFLCLGSHTVFTTTTYQYISITRLCNASQIVVAIAIGDSSKVIPLNLISTVWQFFIVYLMPALHEDWFSICIDICIGSTFVTGVGIFTETWLLAEARAIVREMEASMSEANIRNLLTIMCDAVVSLSPDLKLRQHCPQLHSLLCRGAPLPAGTDTPSFVKYLRQADVSRFKEFVGRAGVVGEAASIHVHLLDALGNGVPVQLFHTCLPLENDSAKMNHLIGVCEDRNNDPDYFPPPREAHPAPSEPGFRSPLRSFQLGEEANDSFETSSQATSISRASSTVSVSRRPLVYVSPVYPFRILQALPKVGPIFGILSPQCEGCNLADWMKEPKGLQEWLEAGIGAVQQDGESMGASYGPVQVRPQSSTDGLWRTVMFLVAILHRPNQPPQVEIEIKRVKIKQRSRTASSAEVAQAVAAHRARSSGTAPGPRSPEEDLLSVCGSIVPAEEHSRPFARRRLDS